MIHMKGWLSKCSTAFLISLSCFAMLTQSTAEARLTPNSVIDTYYTADNQTMAQVQKTMLNRPTFEEYRTQRLAVIDLERGSNFESDTPELTVREQLANDIIMAVKQEELLAGHQSPRHFAPAQHFFNVIDQIRDSKMFRILRKMPKGGILHTHDTAVSSLEYLVSITYREHLWVCNDTQTNEIVNFRFSRQSPATFDDHNLNWTLVAEERSRLGRDSYDAHIRSLFTLRTHHQQGDNFRDISAVWDSFGNMFRLAEPLITFVPVWGDYYRETLREALADNVQYMEFRGTLPTLYDLDNNTFTPSDNMKIYVDVLKDFKAKNPDFIGSKFIFAPVKAVPDSVVEEYIRIVVQLHKEFPDFMAGFDLVGQEASSRQLLSFAERILQLPKEIKFFFHAGETNWFGSVDENLVILALIYSTNARNHQTFYFILPIDRCYSVGFFEGWPWICIVQTSNTAAVD